jgi:hypothetical protein
MKDWQKSIGREAAIALAESRWWERKSAIEIATFQLHTVEMCCPFGVFHEAIEKALGRPVYTHEFGSANIDNIRKKLNAVIDPPTMQQIIEMIPAEKRVVLTI